MSTKMEPKLFITTCPEPRYVFDRKTGMLDRSRRIHARLDSYLNNLGLGYLESSVDGIVGCHTLDASQWRMTHRELMHEIRYRMKDNSPRFIGISANSYQGPAARGLASAVKRWDPESTIIIGGSGPTIEPQIFIHPSVDYIAFGEGDCALPELMKALLGSSDTTHIRGIAPLANGHLESERTRNIPRDLDELPFPARKRHTYVIYHDHKYIPTVEIVGSRGCYAACSFCDSHWVQPTYRERSVGSMVKEVMEVVDRQKLGNYIMLKFEDLNFLKNAERIMSVVDTLASNNIRVRVEGSTRIEDILNAEQVLRTHHDRFLSIYSGAESLNNECLRRWRKGHTLDDILAAERILSESGIRHAFYSIGADLYTTAQELEENARLLFETPEVPRHFWQALSHLPTNIMDYHAHEKPTDGAFRRYTNRHTRFKLFNEVVNFKRIKEIFEMSDYSLPEKIQNDPEVQKLREEGHGMVESAYQRACREFRIPRHKRIDKRLSLEDLKKQGIFVAGHYAQDFDARLSKISIRMQEAILRVCRVALPEAEPIARARIYEDMVYALDHYHEAPPRERYSLSLLKKAVQLDPEEPLYALDLALSYRGKDYARQRRKLFDRFSDDALSPILRLNALPFSIIVPYLKHGDERGLRLLSQVNAVSPLGMSTVLRAHVEAVDKDYDRSLATLDEFLAFCPNSVNGILTLAEIAHDAGMNRLYHDAYRRAKWLKLKKKDLDSITFK
jgi:hypothetical protein